MKTIAFLRAINVGGHTVKMDRLREIFESLKLENVETFIASGNVIFDGDHAQPALEKKIAAALHDALGYEVETFLRTIAAVKAIVDYKPFVGAKAEDKLYVGFLHALPAESVQQKLLAFNTNDEQFHFHGRELYWLMRHNFSDSKFAGPQLEKLLGVPLTMRNITTVRKLAAKYS
jgi:uncharacterized protein (DUF1697 family)